MINLRGLIQKLAFHRAVKNHQGWAYLQMNVPETERAQWAESYILRFTCRLGDVECLRNVWQYRSGIDEELIRIAAGNSFECLQFLLSKKVRFEPDILTCCVLDGVTDRFRLLLERGARLKHVDKSLRHRISRDMYACQQSIEKCIAIMTTFIGIKRFGRALFLMDRFLVLELVKEMWKARYEFHSQRQRRRLNRFG